MRTTEHPLLYPHWVISQDHRPPTQVAMTPSGLQLLYVQRWPGEEQVFPQLGTLVGQLASVVIGLVHCQASRVLQAMPMQKPHAQVVPSL
jgi:hypothetical protein